MTTRIAAGVLAALLASTAACAEEPVPRAGVQAAGTVLWELDAIEHYGLDAKNGFDLQKEEPAGSPAPQGAFLAGKVDMTVSDWLRVARQRAASWSVPTAGRRAFGTLWAGRSASRADRWTRAG